MGSGFKISRQAKGFSGWRAPVAPAVKPVDFLDSYNFYFFLWKRKTRMAHEGDYGIYVSVQGKSLRLTR